MGIVIVDLLCVSPFYDKYLCEAMQQKGTRVRLSSISFHLEKDYFRNAGVRRSSWVMDVVARSSLTNVFLRRMLKTCEYAINILLQSVYFYCTQPHIVHIQWLPFLRFIQLELFWLRFLKQCGFKVVFTAHNILPHDSGKQCIPRFKKLYHLVDHLVVHTDLAKRELVSQYDIDKAKISVIPHGPLFHDVECGTKQCCRSKVSLPKDQEVVLFIGTCKPYKGIEFLVRSFGLVLQECPNAVLVIAGNGDPDYLSAIRALAQKCLPSQSVSLVLRGLSNDELVMYHVASDLVVFPYRDITQSGALLTAMAFGKAIVATNLGGFQETLEHDVTALLVPYNDFPALAAAIVKVLKNPAIKDKIGEGAAQQVRRKYGWDIITEKTLSCYRQLLQDVGV